MVHGKQIQDFSIRLGKINPASNQLLTLVGTSKIQQNAAPILGIDLTNKIYVDSLTDALDTRVTNLENVVYYQNELISGGASFLSGLTFAVTDLVYIINGQLYNSLASNVTISAGDATYDRIDIIVVDTAGVVSVVPGIPALNPIKPDIDETTQVEVTFITVPVGAVTLPIPITVIYNENLGPAAEWTTATNFPSNINVNSSTGTPYMGSKSIELTNVPTGKTVVFTAPTLFDTTTQNTLQFAIKNKVAWTTTRRLRITLQSLAGVQLGALVDVYQGLYGFSSANTTSWQVITIPISKFLAPSSFIGKVVITTYSTSGTLNLYLDYFRMIVGAPVASSQNTFLNIKDDAGAITTATTSSDILSILGGTNITSVIGAKTITLNLDPNIAVTNVTVASAIANRLTYFDGTKTLAPITLGTGLTLTGNVLAASANTTASNGLTKTGNDIRLGGLLTQNTNIDGAFSLGIGTVSPLVYFFVNTGDALTNSYITNGYGYTEIGGSDNTAQLSSYVQSSGGGVNIGMYDQVNNIYANIMFLTTPIAVSDGSLNNYLIIDDEFTQKGLVYNNDYSLNFTDNSLINKIYVDTLVSSITPSGTTNYVSKFTSSNVLGNSIIFDNGTNVGIGSALPTSTLFIQGKAAALGNDAIRVNSLALGVIFSVEDYVPRVNIGATYSTKPSTLTLGNNSGAQGFIGFGIDANLGYIYSSSNQGMRLEFYNTVTSNTDIWLHSDPAILTYNNSYVSASFRYNVQIGFNDVTNNYFTRLYVKGFDATSTNYALKVDSTASNLLFVRNDGVINIAGALFKNKSINLLGVESFYPGEIYAASVFADTFVGHELRFWGSGFSKIYEGTNTFSINITTGGGEYLDITAGLLKLTGIPTSAVGTPAGILGIDNNGKVYNTTVLASSIVTASGTTNYISKFTSATTLGNSLIFDNGTNVGIGTATPTALLHIQGVNNLNTAFKINNLLNSSSFTIENNGNIISTINDASFNINVQGSFGLFRINTGWGDYMQVTNSGAFYFQTGVTKGTSLESGITNNYITDFNSVAPWNVVANKILVSATGTEAGIVTGLRIQKSIFTNTAATFYSAVFLDGNVGIGESAPLARLAILTEDNLGTSYGIKIRQNVSGNDLFYIKGDGLSSFKERVKLGIGVDPDPNSKVTIQGSSTAIATDNILIATNYGGSIIAFIIKENGNIGIGKQDQIPTSRLHLVGINSTSANYAFKVDNTTTNMFSIRNDGVITALPTYTDTSNSGIAGLLGIDSTGKFFNTGISITAVGPSSTLSNKAMVAMITTVTGEQLADPIISLPFNQSYVQVFVNGIKCVIGDGVSTSEVYFADPGDLGTPKIIQDIVIGDVLVRGDLFGFDTDGTDVVDYDYSV